MECIGSLELTKNMAATAVALGTHDPGQRLRSLRVRCGLTTREVADTSRVIAAELNNAEYVISHSRLVQIENDQSTPSIYKLFTLSVVYGRSLKEIISLFLNLEQPEYYHLKLQHELTHPVSLEGERLKESKFHVHFRTGVNHENGAPCAPVPEIWSDLPADVIHHLNKGASVRYGLIGIQDYTMHPLIEPGSIVQIEEQHKLSAPAVYTNELNRPIYFIETRCGFFCSWCEIWKNKLLSVPHPLSSVRIREFNYPGEAEIVGRVTAVATRLPGSPRPCS
jgi:transcriptional regulator with XRE-family HTH domain